MERVYIQNIVVRKLLPLKDAGHQVYRSSPSLNSANFILKHAVKCSVGRGGEREIWIEQSEGGSE